MTNLHLLPPEQSISIDGAPGALHVFPRPHSYNGLLYSTDHYHFLNHQFAEGMDETTILQPSAACTTSSNPPLHDPLNTDSLGLCTNSLSRQQFCEASTVGGSASSVCIPCTKTNRRSWQEVISSPHIQKKDDICTSTDQLQCTDVENILNLHHMIQASATNHRTSTNYLIPSTLTTSATVKLPLEESQIAAHEKGMPATCSNPNRSSFLSALSQGDEAFFKQQLLVPMEGCIDHPIKQGMASRVFRMDHEADLLNDPPMKQVMQHGFDDHNILQPTQLWGYLQENSVITDLSIRPSQLASKSRGLSACAHMNMSECSKDDDEKIRARQDSTYHRDACRSSALGEDICSKMSQFIHIEASRSESEYIACTGKTHHSGEDSSSKKRSLADIYSDSAGYMAQSKRAHLGPPMRDSIYNIMRHSSSSTSLNMMADSSTQMMNGTSTPTKSNATSYPSKHTSGKSWARNPLGPALNTNLKPRARQGTTNDPQTVAARNRRERINARLKVLQELVPNGSKVDLVTMLEKAINYVKFLQLQLRVLSNDELWQAKEIEKVALQHMLSKEEEEEEEGADIKEETANSSAQLDHTSPFSYSISNICDKP